MAIEKKMMEFIVPEAQGILNYSHRTFSREAAESILNNGFEFCKSLYNTTDPIVNDEAHVTYWQNLRKKYGQYIIVISIARDIMAKYSEELQKFAANSKVAVEQLLTEREPFFDEDEEEDVFTLPSQYVKGFYDEKTGSIVQNPNYNPYYNSPVFSKNLDNLLTLGETGFFSQN